MDREELEMRVEIYIFGRLKGQADFRTIIRKRNGKPCRILRVVGGENRTIRMELNLDSIYKAYNKTREEHGAWEALEKTLQQVEKKIIKGGQNATNR